jgi:nucleotide-binding universal stress UspA family protein
MAEKLLVALDSTAATEKILEYVARFSCRLEDMQVHLATIAVGIPDESQELAALQGKAPEPELHGAEDHREKLLALQQTLNDAASKLQTAGVPASRISTALLPDKGGIAADLFEAARTFDCTTLVVGRHHGSSLQHFLLGSTAVQLVEDAVDLTLWVVA